jgi:uncharacterized damage-inducible protein DinB
VAGFAIRHIGSTLVTPEVIVPLAPPLHSVVTLLQEMHTLVERLDQEEYTRPAPGRSSGGVGGHVRHCLDHVSALIAATYTGVCAYDGRARGTDVETHRGAALTAIAGLIRVVAGLDPSLLHREIDVEIQLDRAGAISRTRSSFGRELIYIMSHTIHHNALVALMLRGRGIPVDPHLGLAPSTPSESESVACAR